MKNATGRSAPKIDQIVKSVRNQGQILAKIKSRFKNTFSRGWGLSKLHIQILEKIFEKFSNIFQYPGGIKNKQLGKQRSDTMAYFNYHAKAKQLIADGHLTRFEIVDKWNNISPALVLYFDNNKPMPIREYRFDEYLRILQ